MFQEQVLQIMSPDVVSVGSSSLMSDAVSLMAEKGISFLVVSSRGNKPIGVLTERDVLKRMSEGKDGNLVIKDVMSSPVLTIGMEEKVISALHRLVINNVRHLVVTDRKGLTAGVITLTNFLDHLGFEYFVNIKGVSDIMIRTPITIGKEASIREALISMVNNQTGCIIVEDNERPVGIFTERDAVRLSKGPNFKDTAIGDVMIRSVLTVSRETHVLDAVSLMQRKKVRHLPVVDENGKVAGLIGQMEIARNVELKYAEFLKMLILEQDRQLREANESLEAKVKERTKELMISREELRNLASNVQSVREEERRRIARDIHDDLGQFLTIFRFDLSWLEKRLSKDQRPLIEKINRTLKLIDEAIDRVQNISSLLRPMMLDDLGVQDAMEWQAEKFEDSTGIKCTLRFQPDPFTLEGDLSTEIFRIYQEALTNVARHARATKTDTSIEIKDGRLMLVFSDNGRGIPAGKIFDPGSIGLIGIRERVHPWEGNVEIIGKRGKGTTLTVTVPIDAWRGKR